MKKETFDELKEKYKSAPSDLHTYTIDGISYTVVSHYAGTKDVNAVIRAIAEKQAYADMKEVPQSSQSA